MYFFFGALIFCILLVVVAAALFPQQQKKTYTYTRKEYFLTQREVECYKRLVALTGEKYEIFAQVSLGSLLDERKPGQNWLAARAHIARKSVDFLLCDKEFISPKLAIELDDWTHQRSHRVERDREVERLFKEAGIPLLRINKSEELNEKLSVALSNAVSS